MAAQPAKANVVLRFPMDLHFDLDEVLTFEENVSNSSGGGRDAVEDSSALVSKMPTVEGVADACSICMEPFSGGVHGKQVPCGHVFHGSCISLWLSFSDSHSCPLCRGHIAISTD